LDNPELWNAVISRDTSRDGSFVLPCGQPESIAGRHARRAGPPEQISFSRSEAAEQAGFRACRRCHPRRVHAAIRASSSCADLHALDEHDEEPQTLKTLSAETGVSAHHLQRTFKEIMGITPRQYAESRRLNQFKANVKRGASVTEAMYDAGYGSSVDYMNNRRRDWE
jgi:AraC family transcriptional regulator of adaptative response/methylated-DNA-[protein]-cysteine methyltransferase